MLTKLPFLVLTLLIAGCGPRATESAATETSAAETVTPSAPASEAEDAALDATLAEERAAAVTEYEGVATPTPDNFPFDQVIVTNAAMLGSLCTNKYGCLEEKLYPLGWSRDGKFAYLLQEAHEATLDLTLHFIIQNMVSDEILVKDTYQASKEPGFREEKGRYTPRKVWTARRDRYAAWITEHEISEGMGTSFYPLTEPRDEYPYRFTAENQKERSELFDLDFVARHRLIAELPDLPRKTILNHIFGKYDFALGTQVLGFFVNPLEPRIAVVNAFEKRGYEGPPNVLKMMVVGCAVK